LIAANYVGVIATFIGRIERVKSLFAFLRRRVDSREQNCINHGRGLGGAVVKRPGARGLGL